LLTGGQSGRLPTPGEKSVAFNINSTQELKAFLENSPIFSRGCGPPVDGGKKRAHKNLPPLPSHVKNPANENMRGICIYQSFLMQIYGKKLLLAPSQRCCGTAFFTPQISSNWTIRPGTGSFGHECPARTFNPFGISLKKRSPKKICQTCSGMPMASTAINRQDVKITYALKTGPTTYPRASMNKDAPAKALKLTSSQIPMLCHPVKYKK